MITPDAHRQDAQEGRDELGPAYRLEVVRYAGGEPSVEEVEVPTEVPLTVVANGVEVATLLATPTDLRFLVLGFLFSAGMVRSASELLACRIDPVRWVADCELTRTPDPELLNKRVYTSGCGKGVMFANVVELAGRKPLEGGLRLRPAQVVELASALNRASGLYRRTRGVHTAALGVEGSVPERWFDDVGRHNAVDKAIGHALAEGVDLGRCALVCSGRTSSEILHKARRAGIPVCISRGSPTHQSVLRARDMGVTLICHAKGGGFTVYAHPERIVER